jgi:hypothetical protein
MALGRAGWRPFAATPGSRRIIIALERRAEHADRDEQRSTLRKAADLLRDAPSETVAVAFVEAAKRLAGM